MNIVFWQNSFSIHQLPYIVKLPNISGIENVTFVTGNVVSKERQAMGWNVPNIEGIGRCNIIIDPNDEKIASLFLEEKDNTIHLFSGIRGHAFVFKVFKISLIYKLTRGLIVERPNTFAFGLANAKPLWLHRIKFYLQDAKYSKHIKYVFAMGNDAVDYYQSLCKKWMVFNFAYCVNVNDKNLAANAVSTTLRVCQNSHSFERQCHNVIL